VAFLERQFLEDIAHAFGPDADPDFYEVNLRLLSGPDGKGAHLRCPRDGCQHCSYVDALDPQHTGAADVMLLWSWQYTVHTVIESILRWCHQSGRDPERTYVWQDALCINQYRVEARAQIGGMEPFEDFSALLVQRMKEIRHVLVLLAPWPDPFIMERMWCMLELYVAIQIEGCQIDVMLSEQDEMHLKAAVQSGGLHPIWRLFERVRIQHAKVTAPDDRENILRFIDAGTSQHDISTRLSVLNVEVSRFLQQWFISTAMRMLDEDFAARESTFLRACDSVACLLMEASDWMRAEEVLEAGRQSCEGASAVNGLDYAALLRSSGMCFSHQGRFDEARACFEQSKALFEEFDAARSTEYAGLLAAFGSSCSTERCYEEAMELYRAAKKVYEAVGATGTIGYANLLASMGADLSDRGDHDEATLYLKSAKTAFEAAGATTTTSSYANLLARMGNHLLEESRYTEAMALCSQAKAIREEQSLTATVEYAALLRSMGLCCTLQEQYSDAEPYYTQAKAMYELLGLVKEPGYAEALKCLGECFVKQGRFEDAMDLYSKAKLAVQAEGPQGKLNQATLVRSMGACLSAEGRHQEAMEFYSQAKALYESLGVAESAPEYVELLKAIVRCLSEVARQAADIVGEAASF